MLHGGTPERCGSAETRDVAYRSRLTGIQASDSDGTTESFATFGSLRRWIWANRLCWALLPNARERGVPVAVGNRRLGREAHPSAG